MKKIINLIFAITLSIASNAYADIQIKGADGMRDQPESYIYTTKIKSVDYIYKGRGGQYDGTILVILSGVNNDSRAYMYFTKDDKAFGNALAGALGKRLEIYYTDKYNSEIDQLRVE